MQPLLRIATRNADNGNDFGSSIPAVEARGLTEEHGLHRELKRAEPASSASTTL